MSFKNKNKGKLKKFSLYEKRDKLTEAAFLIEGERFDEAIEFLEDALKKYPNEAQFWECLAFAASEAGEVSAMQKAFAELTKMKPNDAEILLGLATSYALENRVALAHQIYREIAVRFPGDEQISDVHEAIKATETELRRIFVEYGLPFNDAGLEIACKHEKVQVLMNQHKFDEAVALARQLLSEKPDFVPALNNLSLVLYMNGDVAEAVTTAEKVLETKPDNFHALANLVRFSVFLGRDDEARKFAERLRKTESANPDLVVKKIEAFSFLGDDEAVVEEYEKSKNVINEFEIPQSYAKHLAAFAFYRLGEAKKSRKKCGKKSSKKTSNSIIRKKISNSLICRRTTAMCSVCRWLIGFRPFISKNYSRRLRRSKTGEISIKIYRKRSPHFLRKIRIF